MSYSVYLVKNRAGFFLDFEHPTLQGQSPAPERPGNSFNSFNSLLRRLRPTNELRRSPQPRCKNSINSNLRRERPERAASPQPRSTPWESAYKRPRPVRAKVWANGWLLLLPLQGVGNGDWYPGRCPGLGTCWAFSPRRAADKAFPIGQSQKSQSEKFQPITSPPAPQRRHKPP